MAKSPLIVSRAHQWVKCNGSVLLQTLYPRQPNDNDEARQQGIAFHAKSQQLLNTYITGERSDVGLVSQIDTLCDNGVLFDREMYDAVMSYTGDIFQYANEHDLLNKIKVEERIALDCIYEGVYGYCDAHVINTKQKELVVWEGKYGHELVEAFENWQLICYVMGILEHIDGYEDQQWTVRLRVSQPRGFHPDGVNREWVIKASDLRPYFNLIKAAAHAALTDGQCVSGPQCSRCTARHTCDTLTRNIYAGFDYVGSGSTQLTGRNLGYELTLLDRFESLLKARKSGVEEQAIAEIRGGGTVAGWMNQQRWGRERWRKDINPEEVIMMGDMMGVDLRKPRELDTPAQCLKKGVDESVIKEYSERPNNGYKLVKDDGSQARQVFGKS